MANDATRIEKPCEQCGKPMYCTPLRKICTKCKKENNKIDQQKRRDTLKGNVDFDNIPFG